MKPKGKKRLFFAAVGIIFSLICIDVSPTFSRADSTSTDTTVPKVINVVYDDSNSMHENGSTRWSQAKYALEVFSAMMGEKDTLNIYNMSEFSSLNTSGTINVIRIKGNDANRVSKVHDMNSVFWGTPVESIYGAADDLRSESASSERWLVVLTDGDTFSSGGKNLTETKTVETLTEVLNGYASEFKVAYLAIGQSPTRLESRIYDFHSYTAKDTGGEILKRVTEIANLIFEYLELPSSAISNSGSTYSLDIDIPTSQIIAFAQGEGVSVSSMTLNGKDITGESMTVKFSDNKPLQKDGTPYPKVVTDESLKGVVSKYNSGGSVYDAGTFDISIANARPENVVFYYKPGVEATCRFLDENGKVVDSKTGLCAGDYSIDIAFVNPLTGEAVNSNLLKIVSQDVTVTNNGTALDTSGGKVTLEEGRVELKTTIGLEGNVRIGNSKVYDIKPEPVNLNIILSVPEESYKASELGDTAAPITATVMDVKTGQPITKEQWDQLKIDVSGEKGEKYLDWGNVQKGSSVGTYKIRPSAKNDKAVSKIENGKYRFDVTVSGKLDGEKAEAKASGSITIQAYEGTEIVFVPEEIKNPVRMPDLGDFKGITITAYIVDSDTGDLRPLSEDVWNELKVKISSPKTKRIKWTLEKGTQVGTYVLKPGYMWKFMLFTYGSVNGRETVDPPVTSSDGVIINKASKISATITGNAKIGPMTYSGKGTAGLSVAPLTREELWAILWKYLLGFAILLFLIIGYTKKKRINRRKMNPHISFHGVETKVKYQINFWSRVLPFVPEKAIVKNNKPAMQCGICSLKIQANTRGTFKILNAKAVIKKGIRIEGAVVMPDEADRVARTSQNYSSFCMSPIPAPGAEVGMFYMGRQK